MDATNFYIAFYHEQNDIVHFKIVVESGWRKKIGVREYTDRKSGKGLTEYVIRTRRTLLIPKDLSKWLHSNKVDFLGKPAKSWLGAPMIVEDKVLGIIGVQSFVQENAYDVDDKNVLTTIASQTAIAISKAKIFREAKNRLRELEALYDTSNEIAEKSLDIMSVLQAIVKRAVELSKAQGGAVFLCDFANKELKIVVTHNLDILLGLRIRLGTGMAGQVAQSGIPMLHNDYYKRKEIEPIFKLEGYKKLFRALAEVPLKSGGKVIGVLAITTSEKNRFFTKNDIRLLENFAGPAAIAINNARTHSYLQTLIDNTPDAIIAVDARGIVTEFNRASENILGYRMEEVIGKPVIDLYWEGSLEAKRMNYLIKAGKNGKVKDIETTLKSKEGERIPIRFSGSLLYDEKGEKIGSIGHLEDLREIRRLEDRYRALYEVGKVSVEVPESAMRKICQEIMDVLTKRVLYFKTSLLYLMNEENELELMAVGGDTGRHSLKSILKRGQYKYIFSQSSENSSLAIPLIVRGREIGQITVFKGEEYKFSEEEKEFLERFASLAALVIYKAKDINRRKKISETLQEITYDIVALSGENIIGDMLLKVERIIKRRIPNINFCIYKCHSDNDQLAEILDSIPDDFRSRLKVRFFRGEGPFKPGLTVNPEHYRVIPVRSSGQSNRIEGIFVIERIPAKDGLIRPFNEIENLIISMLASALGIALFQWRRKLIRNINGSDGNNLHQLKG